MTDAIIAILGIAVITALVLQKKNVKENFWGLPARTYKRDREYKVENKYDAPMFSVPPTYQGVLSPRFSNVGYSAEIRYNIPDKQYQGVPEYPLTYQGNVKEPFTNNVGRFASDAQNGMFQVQNGGLSDIEEKAMAQQSGAQIYNYDRLIVAQKRSRLHGLGDPIRGDLAIVPVQSDWFRPSVYPNIDLRQGAMTVIAGHDNSTAKELRALQAEYSGKTALAQKDISLGAGQADIIVTAFP